jgi:hypothetical protein
VSADLATRIQKFYEQYPMMRPHFGSNFHGANIPSLLLIGESHYLLEDSSQHLSPEKWYTSNSDTLSPDEKATLALRIF